MAVNDLAILAGEGGSSLCYVADTSDALDTALAALTYSAPLTGSPLSGLMDAGWCAETGLVSGRDFATSGLAAYGSRSPVRTFVTTDTRTFQISFLETNPVTVAVYEGQKLSEVTATAGVISVETGNPSAGASYSVVFEVHDGDRGDGRIIVPRADVTAVDNRTIAGGAAIVRTVTFTAKPVTITTTPAVTGPPAVPAVTRVVATREIWYVADLV